MPQRLALAILLLAATTSARAQQHDMHAMASSSGSPTASGQYAFATIAEIVRLLKADTSTDWSKVNVDALRQHLIDMDDVMTRATVLKKQVPGGLQMDVTGTGRTVAAIKRMVASHAHVLEEHTDYHPVVSTLPTGVRLIVTAKDPTAAATVAMIRGLGFGGIMVEGDHHAAHHLAMARGGGMGH